MEENKSREWVPFGWHKNPDLLALQLELQDWIEKHDLTDRTSWWPAEKWRLMLTSDGELKHVLYCPHPFHRPEPVQVAEKYRKLREDFEAIVARHRYYMSYESTTHDNRGVYFAIEPRPDKS